MDSNNELSQDAILEPLKLTEVAGTSTQPAQILHCLFCDFTAARDDEKIFLQHLYMEHRTVISDVNEIKDLSRYLIFWKKEFEGKENDCRNC